MNKWNFKGHHRRQEKRETRKKNLCMAWISKLLENVSVISKKALETLKERDPNPARSSKVAHDVEKSVKTYQEIYDEKTRKTKQSSIYSFFKLVRHVVPVTPADPATAGPSSISSFFKSLKCANPATAGPYASASNSADDDVLSLSAHSVEDKKGCPLASGRTSSDRIRGE
ncbi:hypothetical protein E2C01_027571 [Portunus trituberculatus]|uniref:Uncharacterized protein n=1 Tax=Portunus trituberculatus TaxID=210409 RepID=A0A5B7EI78_PORTR|nr:hypothetical protein [Portunus trituberculatus]